MYFKKRSHSLNKIVKKNYTLKTFISRKKSFKRDFINSFEAFLLTLMCILPYELYSNSLFQ